MLAKIVTPLLFASLVVCDPKGHHWQHPRVTDIRSPCPGVNALANHGFLPRNGMNISLEQFITGIQEGFNFEPNFTRFAVSVYQSFTTTGNNNTLNLNDLEHHAIPGEHDGSLSRSDLFLGDNHSFNKTIWDSVAAFFHHDTISIPTAARARNHRFAAAKALNPHFVNSTASSMGETALYLRAMRGQDKETKTEYVQILFREERIPFDEGYKITNVTVTQNDLVELFQEILAAS
ncbi:MAG: hypothetical protein Q9220_006918 [cf. Caloplaca sp. 1 TL-2023]